MTWNTSTVTSHVLELDGIEYPTEHRGDEYMDPKVTIEGEKHTVVYAIRDEFPSEFEWGDVKFQDFRSAVERDGFANDELEDGKHVFIVEKYEHSGVHYSLVNTGNYPDRQWDVAPSAVLSLPSDFTEPEGAAKAWLDEYNEWCAGNVYGIATETFIVKAGEPVAYPHPTELPETVWGFIGTDYVEQCVERGEF